MSHEPTPADNPNRGPRITRVVTRTGDDGMTGIVGGQRLAKNHARIQAYGTVDELSAFLGVARLEVLGEGARFADAEDGRLLERHLTYLQNELFTVAGDLATPMASRHPMMPVVGEAHIARLDEVAESFNAVLPPLRDFILAGGSRTATALHVARTVARRAERETITLQLAEEIGPFVAIYLNRVSDVLFTLARWANVRMGVADTTWQRQMPEPPLPPAP